jgi:hypothetical protein
MRVNQERLCAKHTSLTSFRCTFPEKFQPPLSTDSAEGEEKLFNQQFDTSDNACYWLWRKFKKIEITSFPGIGTNRNFPLVRYSKLNSTIVTKILKKRYKEITIIHIEPLKPEAKIRNVFSDLCQKKSANEM